MKKILPLIVLVVLVIFALVSPYFVGRMLEAHIDKTIALINSRHQSITLEKVSFTRHWFSSDVSLKAHLHEHVASNTPNALQLPGLAIPSTQEKTVNILLKSQIHHGPFMFAQTVEGSKRVLFGLGYVNFTVYPQDIENIGDSIDLARLATLVKDQPLFRVANLVTWIGNDHITFQTAAVSHNDESGKIDWNGVSGKINLSSHRPRFSAEIISSPLSFVGKEGQNVETKAITVSMVHQQDDNGLWVGTSDVNLPLLHIKHANGEKLELVDAKLDVHTHSQKDLFAGDINANFGSLTHNERNYGPMNLTMNLDHLDAKALSAIAQYQASADQNYNAIASLVRQNQLINAITQLLSNQPKLSVDTFSLKTAEGLVTLNGLFELTESAPKENGFLQLEPLLKSIALNLNLSLPTPMADKAVILLAGFYPGILLSQEELNDPNLVFTQEQLEQRAQQRLDDWTNAKLVTKNGNEYTISFKLVQGAIKLNDVAINLHQAPIAEKTATPAQTTPPSEAAKASPAVKTNPTDLLQQMVPSVESLPQQGMSSTAAPAAAK